MSNPDYPSRSVFGPVRSGPYLVRYRLPAGLAEEVLREAQRQNLSPSAVVTAILARGLPPFSTTGLLARIDAALSGTADGGPDVPAAGGGR